MTGIVRRGAEKNPRHKLRLRSSYRGPDVRQEGKPFPVGLAVRLEFRLMDGVHLIVQDCKRGGSHDPFYACLALHEFF